MTRRPYRASSGINLTRVELSFLNATAVDEGPKPHDALFLPSARWSAECGRA